MFRKLTPGICTSVLLASVAAVSADTTINFENLAVGTVVTSQYAGVTFSVLPQSCGGAPAVSLRIANAVGGTSSGTKCLKIDTGCPDFSPDYLRMVFDEAHQDVSFTLGDYAGTVRLRAYSTTSGASGEIAVPDVTIEGTGSVGVHRLVRVSSASVNIRRIEIEESIGQFEAIDDLTFDCTDSTPPIAEITSPAALGCHCNGGSVIGSAYDPDDGIVSFQLHRRAPGVSPWTLIRSSTTEVIDGELGPWTTAAAAGYYYLRLTVTNDCGLVSTAMQLVYLDKQAPGIEVRSPAEGAILGGGVCLDGTVLDQCGGSMAVEYQPVGGGAYLPVTWTSAPWVINDLFASWNTLAGIADGDYFLRTTATDGCGNASTVTRRVTIDNTAPVAVITSPVNCDFVSGNVAILGTASDAHLSHWYLEWTGGDNPNWTLINHSPLSVVGGALGNWNTAGLRACAYTLRLRAYDTAVVSCNDPHVTEFYLTVDVGSCCDVNRDGAANGLDAQSLTDCLLGGACR